MTFNKCDGLFFRLQEVISLHDAQPDQKRVPSQCAVPHLDLPSFLLQSNSCSTATAASKIDHHHYLAPLKQQQDDNKSDSNSSDCVVCVDNQTNFNYEPSVFATTTTPRCNLSGESNHSSSHQLPAPQLSSSSSSSSASLKPEDNSSSNSSASSSPYLLDKKGHQSSMFHHNWSEASECVENLSVSIIFISCSHILITSIFKLNFKFIIICRCSNWHINVCFIETGDGGKRGERRTGEAGEFDK